MSKFTIRVSQRVFYDVEVPAASAVEALRIVGRCIVEDDPEAPDLGAFPMTEADSAEFAIEAIQTDVHGDEYDDPEFVAELARLRARP